MPSPLRKYTPQQVIAALTESRGMVTVAAKRLTCDPCTVRKYCHRYPAVREALYEARETTTDVAELALFKAIEAGESWAVTLYLKTIGKERGYVERTEQRYSGDASNPEPIPFTITIQRSTDGRDHDAS